MFMAFNDNKDITQKYIKSVTYHLHPTFTPSKIKVTEAPFLLSRIGWGYFTIQMDVEFQKWTNLPVIQLEHELSFNKNGHTQSVLLEIEEEMYATGKKSQDIAKDLASQLKNLKIEETKA